MENKIIKFEIVETASSYAPYAIVATYEDGSQLPFQREIKTLRGAKARLTYWQNIHPHTKAAK